METEMKMHNYISHYRITMDFIDTSLSYIYMSAWHYCEYCFLENMIN